MRLLFSLLLLFACPLMAVQPELTLRDKLFNYIASTQIRENADSRNIGLWLNRIQTTGDLRSFDETDLFTGLHTMLMLEEAHQIAPLGGFDAVRQRFSAPYEQYRKDSEGLSGTLNFWPLRSSGTHNFSEDQDVVMAVGIPDIPNDFDDSALGFLWQAAQGTTLSNRFVTAVSDFHDSQSGGFFTWYHPNTMHVDCVVNLNILHALSVYENRVAQLSGELRIKVDAVWKYLQEILEKKESGTCGRFYSRSSQFFVALARVYHARKDSVPFVKLSVDELKQHARTALHSKNGTEIAEYIIALKYFADSKDTELKTLAEDLQNVLRLLINEQSESAFIAGDSVFVGRSKDQHWYSPAQSTATALLALTLP
jgi:hypothetical protein